MAEKRFIRLGNPMFLLLMLLAGIAVALYWNEGRRAAGPADTDPAAVAPSATPAPPAVEAVPAPAPLEAPPAAPAPSPEAARLDAARAAVVDMMKDPGSAQFRNERALEDGRTICMEVNGKNAYGGYVGYQAAVVITNPGSEPVAWVDTSDSRIARTACEQS